MQIVITTDSNNIIKSVHQVLNQNESYQGIVIETSLDIDTVYLVDNYRLAGNILVELTEEEQIDICPTPPPTNEELNNQLIETQKLCLSLQKQILLK